MDQELIEEDIKLAKSTRTSIDKQKELALNPLLLPYLIRRKDLTNEVIKCIVKTAIKEHYILNHRRVQLDEQIKAMGPRYSGTLETQRKVDTLRDERSKTWKKMRALEILVLRKIGRLPNISPSLMKFLLETKNITIIYSIMPNPHLPRPSLDLMLRNEVVLNNPHTLFQRQDLQKSDLEYLYNTYSGGPKFLYQLRRLTNYKNLPESLITKIWKYSLASRRNEKRAIMSTLIRNQDLPFSYLKDAYLDKDMTYTIKKMATEKLENTREGKEALKTMAFISLAEHNKKTRRLKNRMIKKMIQETSTHPGIS